MQLGGRLTGGWINKDALCSQAGHVESSAVTPVSSPFLFFCKKRCLFLSPGVGEGGVAATQPAVATTSAAGHNGRFSGVSPSPRSPPPTPGCQPPLHCLSQGCLQHMPPGASLEAGENNRAFIFSSVCRGLQEGQALMAGMLLPGSSPQPTGATDPTDPTDGRGIISATLR